MYAYADDDNGYWRKNLPKNVIPFPFKKPFKQELDEMEKEREKLEKDKKVREAMREFLKFKSLKNIKLKSAKS